jgi:hypothetical protein
VPEIFGLATGYWILVVAFVVVGLLYLVLGRARGRPDDPDEDEDDRDEH